MKWKNIIFVGTSHIAKQSLKEVNLAIENFEPEIICLELDRGRAQALMQGARTKVGFKEIRKIGIKGYLFAKFGAWAEEKLGKSVGVKPGEEMKTALKIAQKEKIAVVFIDQDISITLKELSRRITWKEKWRFFVDILKSVFTPKKAIPFDLNKVPKKEAIDGLIRQVKERYPNFYKVLIEDRNNFMARALWQINRVYPEKKILAIMGAGHLEEVVSLLERVEESKT